MPAKQVSPEAFHLFYTFPYWSPVIIFSLIPAPFLVIFLKSESPWFRKFVMNRNVYGVNNKMPSILFQQDPNVKNEINSE